MFIIKPVFLKPDYRLKSLKYKKEKNSGCILAFIY